MSLPFRVLRRTAFGVILGAAAALAASPVSAQQPGDDAPGGAARAKRSESLEGFWPTPRMIDYALKRWSSQIAHDYELNEDQARALEEMMLRRWPEWMTKNRPLVQPVFNEFMENRIAPEPPSSEQVSQWAARALEAFESARGELREAQEEFRPKLSPSQKMRFDMDVAKLNVGMEVFEQKLKTWEQGQYATRDLWDRPPWLPADRSAPGSAGGAEARAKSAGTELQTVPLDRWESFVADFIRRHSLDQEQITSAWTIMGDLRAQAELYRERHREDYLRIEQQLAKAREGERQSWLERRKNLDQRIDLLFEELKDRLNRLLTDAQRNAAPEPPASS